MNEWYVNGDGVQLQNLVVIGYLQLGNQMLKWTKNFVDQMNIISEFWLVNDTCTFRVQSTCTCTKLVYIVTDRLQL